MNYKRIYKISKKILSEYMWLSKEEYPNKPNWGGPWEETEKGWSCGKKNNFLNFCNFPIESAIKEIMKTKKYDDLIDINDVSNNFNYVSDKYGLLYNKLMDFDLTDDNINEYKNLIKKMKECSVYLNLTLNHGIMLTMEKISLVEHMKLTNIEIFKPNKKLNEHDYKIYKDTENVIKKVFNDFCLLFSDKYNIDQWGNLEVYVSDKILRSESLEGRPNININASTIEYWESYSEKTGLPHNKDKKNKKWCVNIGTLVHELAHHMEHVNNHINNRCKEFLEYRTNGENHVQLNKLWLQNAEDFEKKAYPNGPYEWDEIARPDNFFNPYCGKFYPDGNTEIFSMGVQRLLEDPINFLKEDKEYFYFIISLMRGEL